MITTYKKGIVLLAFVLCGAACAGGTSTGTSSGATGSSGSSGGNAACPVSLPESGGPCVTGRRCEYGTDPKCLSSADCIDGKWSVASARCAGPDPSCPATREAAAGTMCPKQDATCNYAGLGCICTNCTDGPAAQCMGPTKWQCEAPNLTPGCPPARPNLGSACAVQGLVCDYGCAVNASRTCTDGAWLASSRVGGCPTSTRDAKERIVYLTQEAQERLADEARGLRLASWHYKDPALAERERVGYILEDAPAAHCSDMQRKEVDIYAYTSMVLAMAQSQERELQVLRAKVAELDRRVPRAKK
jgi:hypothetical protein